tara:strand:+ start:242 stop:469 length:228 start_codon:yes stop_codon:yes gene_type:complete
MPDGNILFQVFIFKISQDFSMLFKLSLPDECITFAQLMTNKLSGPHCLGSYSEEISGWTTDDVVWVVSGCYRGMA